MTRPTRTTRSTRPQRPQPPSTKYRAIEIESKRDQLGNVGVPQTDQWKRNEAVIKRFATEEHQVEKGKMQEWKEIVM